MKAVTYDSYGPYSALKLREVDVPDIGDKHVLVRMRAAALHIGDCFAVKGAPFLMRAATGLLEPNYGVPGFDLAGQVETVGKNVKRLRPGDEVFGTAMGTCADFARADESTLETKPANLTFEQAAAIPTSGLTALHGLRDAGKLKAGQRILINGASGGIGSFAVQIAKSFGAQVTGVCSTQNAEMVRSLGADNVIDYTQEDFTRGAEQYDVIFDNVENRSLADVRRVLKPTGILVLNSGTGATGIKMMVRLVKPLVISPFARQDLRRYLSTSNHKDLSQLKELAENGKLKPAIDRTYPLAETAEALAYIERGHARGKVVIRID